MDKKEFLQALEKGLSRAAPDERVAAMQYYTEYFDEAGPEREAEVLQQLGDPGVLAQDILAGSGENAPAPPQVVVTGPADGQPIIGQVPLEAPFTPSAPPVVESPFDQNAPQAPLPVPVRPTWQPPPQAQRPLPQPSAPYSKDNNNTAKIILIILLVVFLAPVWGGLFGTLFGLLVAMVVLFFVPLIVGVALAAAGIASVVVGALVMTTSVANGLVALGTGVLVLGLGLMAFYGGVMLVGKVLPAIIRAMAKGISSLWRKLFPKATGGVQNG